MSADQQHGKSLTRLALSMALVAASPSAAQGSRQSFSPQALSAEQELEASANAYRVMQEGDLAVLDRLSKRLTRLIGNPALPPERRAVIHLFRATVDRDRVLAGDISAREQALASARTYLQLAGETDRASAADAWAIQAVVLSHPLATATLPDLKAALGAFDRELALIDSPAAATEARFNRATAAIHLGDSAELEKAIGELERLLSDPAFASSPSTGVLLRLNLAGAYLERQAGDRTVSTERALALYEQAQDRVDARRDPGRLTLVVRNFACALQQARLKQPQRTEQAVALVESDAARAQQGSSASNVFDTRLALAEALRRRAAWTGGEDLNAAANALGSLAAPAGDTTRAAQLRAARAELLEARRAEGDASISQDDVVTAARAALAGVEATKTPRLWASLQNNLGNACNQADRPDLDRCARDAYAAALAVRTFDALPLEHFDTLTNLGQLEFRRGHWAAAAEIANQLTRRSDELFAGAAGAGVAIDAAARATRSFENGAYALARLGRTEEAYRMLDGGRARGPRQRLGFRGDVARGLAPTGAVVVAPLVTNHGVAVFACIGGRIRVRFLDVRGQEVAAHVSSREGSAPGWLQRYDDANDLSGPDEVDRDKRWASDVADMADWLGTRLVQPILDWLSGEGVAANQPIAWSVQGELAILPLAAATLRDGRPLVSVHPTSLIPAEVFLARPKMLGNGPVISFANPTDDPALAYAATESALVRHFAGVKAERPLAQRVTGRALLQAMGRAQVLHFAGHAWYDPDAPEESFLEAADGHLTLRAILAAHLQRGPDLVILSACESGRVQVTRAANEFQGLPIGFLGAGAGGVIPTLWPVDDLVALLMVDAIFRQLTEGASAPAEAVSEAQNWLRTATGSDLAQRVAEMARLHPDPKLDEAREALEAVGASRPFGLAAYWGSFYYTGYVATGGVPS